MKRAFLLLLMPLLLFWGSSALYSVDQAEFAYVTQFGEPVAVFDGATDAGLHLKWPWPVQGVQRLDRRLQAFDLPPAELPTNDPKGKTIDKMLVVDAFVCWRVADKDGVERFVQAVGTPDRARLLLGQRVSSRLGAVISTMPLDDLFQVAGLDAVEARTDALRQRLLGADAGEGRLDELVRSAYGVELVDVQLRRRNYPQDVRYTINERITSERLKKVADYESEGDRLAAEITSEADRQASMIRASAQAERKRLEKEADVEADLIRNQAHSRDRDFYTFLQKLEAYQRILGETRDVLLLSSKHEFLELLLKPPKMNGTTRGTPPVAGMTPRPPAGAVPPTGGGQ